MSRKLDEKIETREIYMCRDPYSTFMSTLDRSDRLRFDDKVAAILCVDAEVKSATSVAVIEGEPVVDPADEVAQI